MAKNAKVVAAVETNGKATKKDGLRPLQIKVLEVLNKASGPLSRAKMYDKLAFKNHAGLNDILGKNDPIKRAEADAAKYPSLLTLGHIRLRPIDVDGVKELVYEITAPGKKALAKAAK